MPNGDFTDIDALERVPVDPLNTPEEQPDTDTPTPDAQTQEDLSALKADIETMREEISALRSTVETLSAQQDAVSAQHSPTPLGDEVMAKLREQMEDLKGAVSNTQADLENLQDEFEASDDDLIDRSEVETTEEFVSDEDENVAVDKDAEPGYLGATGTDGVLRIAATDGTTGLTYADGGNFVTIAHADTSTLNGSTGTLTGGTVFSEFSWDSLGHTLTYATRDLDDRYYTESEVDALIAGFKNIPDGTNTGDILVWNASAGAWQVLSAASAQNRQFLVYDTAQTLNIKWSWPPVNAAAP